MECHEQQFPLNRDDSERALDVLQAIADPTRLRLVWLLRHREMSVGRLVRTLALPQSTVSRHLSILRRAKLVRTRRKGTTVFYTLGNTHLGHIVSETLSLAEHERLALPDHGDDRVTGIPLHHEYGEDP
ncbi:MAG: metalloregulator ArsR/SmtB family transcription factor [Spirochaetia bacterium]